MFINEFFFSKKEIQGQIPVTHLPDLGQVFSLVYPISPPESNDLEHGAPAFTLPIALLHL